MIFGIWDREIWYKTLNLANMSQGPINPEFMQEKVQKGPRKNWIFCFVLGSYESLEGLER